MTLSKLDAKQLFFATIAGCHAVVRERETLNAINVFPVQDGDTGDNMAATASAVIHHASPQASIKDTLKSVADASMTGARGNSGMIFSQFFNALADFAQDVEEPHLCTTRFGNMLQDAAIRVRSAILNPIDGTMLTIMEKWSDYTAEALGAEPCFKLILKQTTEKLQDAVTQTTQTLAALQAADVVDAGALGFFHFVNGFSQFVADPASVPNHHTNSEALPAAHVDFCGATKPTDGRFCTEAMISYDKLDQKALMAILKEHGSSVVITSNASLCRFHLHTDKPWEVFEAIKPLGRVHHPKVDDMLRQYQTINERKHNIALVTDSNADLPWDMFEEKQIHIIPLNVHIEQHDLLDRYTIKPEQFYRDLSQLESHPKTSCPSTLSIEQKLKPLADRFDHVIVLSLAQSLSSTHDTIKHVAEKFKNIHVINSKRCSAAQGLLLNEAMQLIEANKPIEMILAQLEAMVSQTQFWFMIHDMTALIRSGRINKIIGKMTQYSGLKPFFSLTPEGKPHLSGQAFSEQAALQKILASVTQRIDSGDTLKSYALVHANAPELIESFAKQTEKQLGMKPLFIESVSSTIGIHAGAGCMGLAALFE